MRSGVQVEGTAVKELMHSSMSGDSTEGGGGGGGTRGSYTHLVQDHKLQSRKTIESFQI